MAHRWSTIHEGRLKLQYGKDWTAEDDMDLTPTFPDMDTDEARRESWFTVSAFHVQPRQVIRLATMTVSEICDHYGRLKDQVPSAWNAARITAFEQEPEYRASRHAYETQTQGRTDRIG